jgi:AcrR family transcriptional regulator
MAEDARMPPRRDDRTGPGTLAPKAGPAQRRPVTPEDLAAIGVQEVPLRPPSVHVRLLHAARAHFAREGYENATTASIARDAGTSESQLVKHFGSKAGLLEAIFDAAWEELEAQARELVRARPTPLAGLLAVSDLVIGAMDSDPQLRSLLLLEGRRIRKHGSEVVISSGFRRFLLLVDDLLQRMSAQGDIAAGVHLEALRSAWVGAVESMIRDRLLAELIDYPARFDRKVVRRTSVMALSAFLTPRAQRLAHSIAGSE